VALGLSVLLLLPASGAAAQAALPGQGPRRTAAPADPRQGAGGAATWMRQRMEGELGPDFARRMLAQGARERVRTASARASVANGSQWRFVGPDDSHVLEQERWLDPAMQDPYVPSYARGATQRRSTSGRVRAILPDPSDPSGNTVYVLAGAGGLWRTSDFLSAAPSWAPLTDGIGGAATWGAGALGAAPGTVYLGAGDPAEMGAGGFVVASRDGGASWEAPVPLGKATRVLAIQVDGTGPDEVILVGTDAGLFRSADGGRSYARAGADTVSDVAWVWSMVRTSAGWLAVYEPGGLGGYGGTMVFSTDGGSTWAPVANLGHVYNTDLMVGRTTLAVGAPGDAVVYATGARGDWDDADVWRSDDGGQSWASLGFNWWGANGLWTVMAFTGGYNQTLGVDPSDPARATFFLGGALRITRSLDGGASGIWIADWAPGLYRGLDYYGVAMDALPYVHSGHHAVAFSSFGGVNRMYLGTDGGLFTSTDGGATWDDTKNRGLATMAVMAIAGNGAFPGAVLASLDHNGTRVREGATPVFNQVEGGQAAGDSDGTQNGSGGVGWSENNAVSMCTGAYGDFWRSVSNPVVGRSAWVPLVVPAQAPTGIQSFDWHTPVVTPTAAADPSGQVFFTYSADTHWPAGNSIWQSDADGWHRIFWEGTRGIPFYRAVRSVPHGLGVSPLDLQHLAAAGPNGLLFLTRNGGRSWEELPLGAALGPAGAIPGWQGFNACAAWASNDLLYVCSESPVANAARVGRSADGGVTWNRADAGLPDVPVTKLVVDPGDASGSTVYAATWLGVYRTSDGGRSWLPLGAGLPQIRVNDLWVSPDSSVIRAATHGRGVWELPSDFTPGTVSVSPAGARLWAGETLALRAMVFGPSGFGPGPVSWSSSDGAVSADGLYTPSGTPGTFTVTATSVSDPSRSASATVVVLPPTILGVSLDPGVAQILSGAKLAFAYQVAGGPDRSLHWSASGGSVDANGVFTAPLLGGTYRVTAASAQDPGQAATATVEVAATGELLQNGGLERDPGLPDPWALSSGDLLRHGTQGGLLAAHAGMNWLRLGGTGATHSDEAFQELFLPASLDGATLRLWARVSSDDVSGQPHDTLSVEIRDGSGALLERLGTLSNADRSGPASGAGAIWAEHVFPLQQLASYRGRAVRVVLACREDASLPTAFEVDDLSLSASVPLAVANDLDLNRDGRVDALDLLDFARAYTTYDARCDLDHDHFVGDADLQLLLQSL
jgi:photosystem II stability/assembly factor-like uncharacterized protein